MFIKYEQILVNHIPFFSVLAALSKGIWHDMILVNLKKNMTENGPFSSKISVFRNFDPLGADQDINFLENFFDLY